MNNAPPVVVLNSGSSSLKYALREGDTTMAHGQVDRIGVAAPATAHGVVTDGRGVRIADEDLGSIDHEAALRWLVELSPRVLAGRRPIAIGHRVVYGGASLIEPTRVGPELVAHLRKLMPFAPLHLPSAVAAIEAIARLAPDLPQVACFDTAFHATQERLATLYGLPRELIAKGLRRYGFHGLSYESAVAALRSFHPRAAAGRTVVCHLGSGSSLCAIRDGRSVATTMGLTPLDGLPMATRCGSIDPGIVLYLIEGLKMSPAEVGAMLSTKSGLLGLSGISSDMRELLASSAPEAAEAVAFYCYRIARELGSLVAALGGLDALVFTGGIGENAAPVRAQVCERAAWLGVKLDPRANALAAPASDPAASSASGPPTGPVPRALHAPESAVAVFVVAADEEGVIARHTARIVTEGGNGMAGR